MVLLFFYKLYHPQGIGRKYASYPVFHRVFKNILERNVHGMFLYVIFFHIFDTNQNMVSQWHTIGFAFWSPFRQTKGICGKRSGRSLSQCLQWNHLQDEAPLGGTVLSMGLVVPLQRGCPASSIDMVAHRHYFQKGFQHRLPTGVAIQSPWWSCTLDGFSDISAVSTELAVFQVSLLQLPLHRQPTQTLQQWSWAR